MKRLILLLLLVISAACAAKPRTTVESVRAHMEFLASDAMNGRESGTRDEWIAVTYVAAQLRRLGLEPMGDNGSFVQTVHVERPELAAAPVLSFGGYRFAHGKEITVHTMSAPSLSGAVARFTASQSAMPGSVVVIPQVTRDLSVPLAGAVMVLARSNGCGAARVAAGGLPRVSPRTLGVAPTATRPTCVALDDPTYALAEKLEPGSNVSIAAELKTVHKANTWNAVGRLAGSDTRLSSEVILLSAHIDHVGTGTGRGQQKPGTDTIYNGADDDASGSIAVLELAEAFARGKRPKRTIVFAWFGSEEAGGTGSGFFVDKPVVPLDRMVANLQFEMIGRADPKVPPHTLWLTGYERSNLGPELARRGARLVQDPHPEQSFFTRSDNIRFARRGVIAHTVSSFGLHTDYHQPSDEIRTIDFAHMTDAIRSMIAPIRWLANSTFKPGWRPGMKP